MSDETRLTELRKRLGEIHDLRKARSLLLWDLETMMPPAGAAVRAEQIGTLARVGHERFTADGLGQLLDDLGPYEASLPYDSDDASLLRVTRRDYERARRVPPELRAELARAGAQGVEIWNKARDANDYAVFRPALERNLALQAEYIACFDPPGDPYDVLVAEYEPELTTADLEAVFEPLTAEVGPLVAALEPPAEPPLDLGRPVPIDTVLERVGFDRAWGRVDPTVHPFMVSFGTGDIRLTTYRDGGLRNLFAALHEFGHGLYERGIDPALERTPLAGGASSALHESQSLLWENLVGRGELFCRWLAGVLEIDAADLYRAANRIERSLIRVDADPVTYSLHVVFRFELERGLVNGSIDPADLREEWNARVADSLGLDVPDDKRGVLQDIHWSDGLMGYFPSYALGHVASVQIWERLRADLPTLDDDLERGEFGPLTDWLREHVHRHGCKFTPVETLQRVVGTTFDPTPLAAYIRQKLEGR
jgi:carboxypeptidase Taq